MKKVFFKLMAIAVVVSLAACNNPTGSDDENDQDSAQVHSTGEQEEQYPANNDEPEAEKDTVVGGKAEKVEGDPEAIISRGKVVEEVEEEKKEERRTVDREAKEVKPDEKMEGVLERGKKVEENKEDKKKKETVKRSR